MRRTCEEFYAEQMDNGWPLASPAEERSGIARPTMNNTYETVTQIAGRWGVIPQRVRALIKAGRIPTAIKPGHDWLIPAGTPKPADARLKK